MNSISDVLFLILKSKICSAAPDLAVLDTLSNEQIIELCRLSNKHDLSHIICAALLENKKDLPDVLRQKLKKQAFLAVVRCENMTHELNTVSELFENEHIDYLPLKGSVLRDFYPEQWMRTSCDIDILVRMCDWERASKALTEKLEYKVVYTNSHDVSMTSPTGISFELHHTLVEEDVSNSYYEVLRNVWENSAPSDDRSFKYEMQPEFFCFYHIAHMAKHFLNGGCGVKPFIDLLIIEEKFGIDKEKTNCLIEKAGLSKFAEMCRRLYKKWFENGSSDEILCEMEEFILNGGSFGTAESRVNMQQAKKKCGVSYALSRIFLPYDTLKYHYPILQKHPVLTPFCEVRRWFKLLFFGGAKRSVNELKINNSISKEQSDKNKNFIQNIGL